MGRKLRESVLKKKIDRAVFLKMEIKEMEEELDGDDKKGIVGLKAIIIEQAEIRRVKVLEGSTGKAKIGASTRSDCDPKDLRKLLKELGRVDEFINFVSVKISQTKKDLGAILWKKVGVEVRNEFGKVTLTEKK